jgi:hypothetical protein
VAAVEPVAQMIASDRFDTKAGKWRLSH